MKAPYFFLLPLIAVSCTRNIDFDYIDIEPLMVVEANLTPDGIQVELTNTTPMDEPMNRQRLTDAIVTLCDLTSGEDHELELDNADLYVSSVSGMEGNNYRLKIERSGKQYASETQMLGATKILGAQLAWISMPYDEVAVLQVSYVDGPAPGECYWTRVYRNGEIISWSESDDRTAVDGVCTYTNMLTRKNPDPDDTDAIQPGDVITISVCKISRRMQEYLETIANDSNGTKLFSGERVLGFFMATTPAEVSVVYDPEQIPHS